MSEARLTPLKIEETLNLRNSENTDSLSTGKRSSEASNLALWNAFSFIPIRLPVPEISSRKEKINFSLVYYFRPRRLLGSLARTLSHWPIPTPDKWQTVFQEDVRISGKNMWVTGSLGPFIISVLLLRTF